MPNTLKERRYSISDLARLSGIKAHTIRIWEQRYKLLKPKRTDTNIRYYDDDQLRKLLGVSTLISSGIKISHIGKLSETQLNEKLKEIADKHEKSDLQTSALINQLAGAGLSFDEVQFEKTFSTAVLKFGLKNAYLSIIYPFMTKVGRMWGKSEMHPAQEHFISSLMRQKLFSAIDALPLADKDSKSWLLYLPQGEQHDIGLLFASYLIRHSGCRVIYLGPDVPYQNLFSAVKQLNPDYVLFFLSGKLRKSDLKSYLTKMKTDFPKQQLRGGGRPELFADVQSLAGKQIQFYHDVTTLDQELN